MIRSRNRERRRLLMLLLGSSIAVLSVSNQARGQDLSSPSRTNVTVEIAGGATLTTSSSTPVFEGSTNALDGTVSIAIDGQSFATKIVDGRWQLVWPQPLATGRYLATVTVTDQTGASASKAITLSIVGEGRLPRRPLIPEDTTYGEAFEPHFEDFKPYTDRWRIVPPDYELNERSKGRWDPYNQNILKGDFPILGDDIFLSLSGISDTLVEARKLPTPSGVSAEDPGSIDVFGMGDQGLFNQNVIVSADLFRGQTAFQPALWRARATFAVNFNHTEVRERGVVSPDVRRGTDRSDGQLGLQELFYERKLRDLSTNFDFVSIRAGVQPFVSDFRGFVFNDTNLGVRLFGNYDSNRYQYNLAWFERLEKDTNSGLNIGSELRDQRVVVANFYWQDFLVQGYTTQFSYHFIQDDPTVFYDSNGFLVRPDPIGDFVPHEVEAHYLGWTGFGRIYRFNIDHAAYYAFGEDSHNPIAGTDPLGGPVSPEGVARGRESVDISAWMAAFEVSYDRDWLRPRLGYFFASGDDKVFDRKAEGFAAIFANPNFAGGGFSFWNRLGIRLATTGVGLKQRGSFLPDLNSSKDEGQPNFVNPGLHLITSGIDVELTPKAKLLLTANYLRFAELDVLRGVLFQQPLDRDIGVDISVGFRYRPYLNNNVTVVSGAAVFLPEEGFEAIFEDGSPLYQIFTNLTLTF